MKTIRFLLIFAIITIARSQFLSYNSTNDNSNQQDSSNFINKSKQLNSNQDKELGDYIPSIKCQDPYFYENSETKERCQRKCLIDEQCQAVTFSFMQEVTQCFYYNQKQPVCENDVIGFESSFVIKKIGDYQNGARCYNHYNYQKFITQEQCQQNCVNDSKCQAVTYQEDSEKHCFYYDKIHPQCNYNNDIYKSAFVFSPKSIVDVQDNLKCFGSYLDDDSKTVQECQNDCAFSENCTAVSYINQEGKTFCQYFDQQFLNCTTENTGYWGSSFVNNRTIGNYEAGLQCNDHYKMVDVNDYSECVSICLDDFQCTGTSFNVNWAKFSCYLYNQIPLKCDQISDQNWVSALISWQD